MEVAAERRSARATLVVVVVLLSMLTAIGSVAWTEWRPLVAVHVSRPAAHAITDEQFARVGEGMRPADVAAVLGRPSKRTTSLAEGFAWPEPRDVCWYYPSIDRLREYEVCFIAWTLVTRGSYQVAEGEPR
jgi:hypothetical protein